MFKFLCFAILALWISEIDGEICEEIDVRSSIHNFTQLTNCSVIVGNLQIVLLDGLEPDQFKNLSFPKLEEISGYLLFFQVSGLTSLKTLFPNLKVIRGEQLFHNYGLIVWDVPDLKEIGLSNLQLINKGSVRIDRCTKLCYVRTIKWPLRKHYHLHIFDENECSDKCPNECNDNCWDSETCQIQTSSDCHEDCLTCKGPGLQNCTVCKYFEHNGKCLHECPPGLYGIASRCITEKECFDLNKIVKNRKFVFDGLCTDSCPKQYEMKEHKNGTVTCNYCGDKCVKICNGTTISSHSQLLQMVGCTIINGSLVIEKTADQMIGELEYGLDVIREIYGHLKIQHTTNIKSLEFFKRLEKIHGDRDKKRNQSLVVINNKELQMLFGYDQKLEIITGNISFHYNPQLCLSKIERFANLTNRLDNFNSSVLVSEFSNGDGANCNTADLNITVAEVNSTGVRLIWEKSQSHTNASFMGYFVYYMENTGSNLTFYDDACSSKMWETALVPNNTITIVNLKPFTNYSFYIKTLTHEVSMRTETPEHFFMTLSDDPLPPTDIHVIPLSSDSVQLTWKPPESPNGILDKYYLVGYPEEDNIKAIDTRNYCEPVKHIKLSEDIEITTKRYSGLENDTDVCICDETSNNFITPSLENMCYHSDTRYLTEGISVGCETFKHDIVFLEENRKNDSRERRWRRDIERTIQANVTSYIVRDLKHFKIYVFLFSVCNEVDIAKRPQCSAIVMQSIRTLKKDNADDIDSGISVEIVNNDALVKWKEPKNPNGAITSYNVQYIRTDIENPSYTSKCITRKQHINNMNVYKIQNLVPGQYSIKVQAISLAGPGSFTSSLKFTVEYPNKRNIAAIVSITIICILVIIAIVLYWHFGYKRNSKSAKLIATINPDYDGTLYVEDEWEMERNNIEILKNLGHGTFGMVYSGVIKSQNVPCAIKTVNDGADVNDYMTFLKEASVMKSFHDAHHVVKLLGVVSRGQPPLVIMELMSRGDLKNFLRRSRDSSHNITCAEMYRMAAEIADGMAFLASKKFIHRDLAARNCMVSADHTVKIGDFGMARDIYETDYYRKETKGLLPVRWMAPESLADGIFTSDSDVWSYGVVLWEMVTLAEQPYQGLANEQVFQFVIATGTLERPPDCPDLLYEIMEACWKWKPNNRPLFTNIVEKLESHIGQDFRLVSFYHSRDGEEYRMNSRERVYNPPAQSVPAQIDAHWNVSDDEVSLYSGETNRPSKFLSFPHQRHSRPSSNYHLDDNSAYPPLTSM